MKQRMILVFCSMLLATTAGASTSAWVFVNDPGSFIGQTFAATPPERAYNPSGGAITITRTAIGAFTIRFVNLAPFAATGSNVLAGNVQVTPYNSVQTPQVSQLDVCAILGWARATNDVLIHVRCFDPTAKPSNARFTVLYTFN